MLPIPQSRIPILGQRAVSYLYRDSFSGAVAAGAVNGTAADIGTRAAVDTGSKLSVSGGRLQIASNTADGDPRLYDPTARTRQAGLALLVTLALSDARAWNGGWAPNTNGWGGASLGIVAGGGGDIYAMVNSVLAQLFTVSFSTADARLAFVLRGIGGYLIINDRLEWVGSAGTTAALYAGLASRSTVGWTGTADDMRVLQLGDYDARFASDHALATSRTPAPASGTQQPMSADAWVEATWTPGANEVFELDIRRIDANNRWIVRCDQAAGTVKLIQRQSGSETQRASAAQTLTVGTPYRVIAIADGTTILVYVNTTIIGTYGSASFNTAATTAAVSGFVTASEFICWPRAVALTGV